MVSGVKSSKSKRKTSKIEQTMATEQIMSEAIAKAVAEATKVAIQAMAEAQPEEMHDTAGPKIGDPTLNSLCLIGTLRTNTVN